MRHPEPRRLALVLPTMLLVSLASGFAVGTLHAKGEPVRAQSPGARSYHDRPSSPWSAGGDRVSADPDPGVWSIALGGFTRLEDSVAFAEDDIWAVGDGIVHYDGAEWNQVAGFEHPVFHAIDGLSSDQLWAVGEVSRDGCDRSGFVMHRSGERWLAQPVDTHQPLFDVAMVSATEGWAVGGVEVPVILRYDGTRWRETGAPETGGLRAVHMIDEDAGWAVGDRGAIVRYDGHNWMAVRSPTWSTLLDVHMLDRDVGWAVGVGDYYRSGIILAYENGEWFVDLDGRTPVLGAVHTLSPTTAMAVGAHGVLTYFDGDEWREIGRTYPGGYVPYDGDEPEPVQGAEIVVQSSGGPSPLADATAREHRILRPDETGNAAAETSTSNSTSALETRTGPARPDGGVPFPGYYDVMSAMLLSLSLMPDAETLLAVGDAGQVVHIDDQTWAEVHAGRQFVALDMRTADDGWIVGPDGSPLHWDGTSWTAHRVPRRARYLRDVATVGADDAWAVGENGSVVHWGGSSWTLWPSFTSVDLSAVSFSAADDGWVVANIYDRLMDTREARVFHWDGSDWDQVFRLCHLYLTDVAAAGPADVWFATGGVDLLHYDGSEWAWHPVQGRDSPGDYGTYVSELTLTPDGGWGTGSGLAQYDGQVWRTVAHPADYWHRYLDLAAVGLRSFWGISRFYEYDSQYLFDAYNVGYRIYHSGESGGLSIAHEGEIDLASIDAVVDDDGLLHVWAVGGASTVLHYQASAADAALPEPTATPRLPEPELRPSPTPRSSLRPDDVRDLLLSRYDPEGERGLDVTTVDLITANDVEYRLEEYSSESYWRLSWSWRGRADDSCYSWRPIWLAVVEGDVQCSYGDGPLGTHAVMTLDGATGREEMTLCLAAIRSRLHLPIAVGGGRETRDYPTSVPRDLTPRPIENAEGPCPTMTPYPNEPPIGYP